MCMWYSEQEFWDRCGSETGSSGAQLNMSGMELLSVACQFADDTVLLAKSWGAARNSG